VRNPLLRFRSAVLLLLAVMTYGTLGYVAIERWDPVDASFMTLSN
jgi:hypothetical protein